MYRGSMIINYFEWTNINTSQALNGLLGFLVRATDEKETFLGISASGWHELIIDEAPDDFCEEVSQESKDYYSSSDLSRQGQILVSLVNRHGDIKKRILKIITSQYDLVDNPSTADDEFFNYGSVKEWTEVEPALV